MTVVMSSSTKIDRSDSDIGGWLNALGLGQYRQAFADNDIDFETLPTITAEDLRELGVVSLRHRKKLLAAIADLSSGGQKAQPLPQEAPSELPEGEYRQVTVLFADLSGFTRLSTELDAEATHTLLNHYFEVVDRIVENYRGRVDKHIGDNVMAVFGAPIAHSDDPQRAVRTALEIHRAMQSIGEKAGRPLQAHIGIASGQVVASNTGSDAHREYTVTGIAVNLASRLQDMAGPGETYVSDAVQRAIAEIATSEAKSAVEIKGLDQPVQVWSVQKLLEETLGSGHRPFVGRRSELAQFAGVLSACRETGSGQTVFVRGEAGIGKTRLVEEFQRLAEQQGFACYTSLVLDFGVGKGQDTIRTLVRCLLGIAPDSDQDVRAAAVDHAVAKGFLSPNRKVYLNDLVDLSHTAELRAVYDAMDNPTRNSGKQETVAELLRRCSTVHAILVVVEDVHWADPTVLAYLATLATTVTSCPAILIMTSRIEGDPIDQAWRGAVGRSPLMTIDLAPLRETEALELAEEYLQTSNQLAITCIQRAEGNPLFLEQLLRNVEETGEEGVPGSVQSLVQSRMDRLAPSDRTALQAASVLGQRFTLSAVRHLIERPQYNCAGLVEHFLVRPVGNDFLFAHALVREGVYSSLLGARRKELHGRAARWFVDQDPILRAEHLDRAEAPEAGSAYLEAARAQAARYDYARASQLVTRGLQIAEESATRYALTCLHGDILRALGESKGSIEAFERALETAADDAQRSKAWIGQAEGMRIVDRYDEALAALDKAEPAARAQGRAEQLTQIHFLRGNLYFPLGNIDGCLEQHELALEYARKIGSVEDEARALGGLGDAYYQRGRMITAHKHFRRCVELSREHGFRAIEVANLSMVGTSRFYLNELREALEDALAAIKGAAKIGHHRAELLGRTGACRVLLQMNEIDAAREHLREAQILVERLGARRFEAFNLDFLAKILRLEGRRAEAVKQCEKAVVISRETGAGFAGPRVLAELARNTDNPAARRQALHEGEKILREGAVSHNHFYFYADGMDAHLESKQWDEVDRYAAALEEFTRPEPVPWCDFFIARGRTLAAYGRANRDDSTLQELQRLRGEAERVGLRMALPAIAAALADTK
jgi:class 3 adenylate cyclase/tetratricopeptide (TPR) repeat protein